MTSALISSLAALMLTVYPVVPWGTGVAGSGILLAASVPESTADRCRPLAFGIAGAATLCGTTRRSMRSPEPRA